MNRTLRSVGSTGLLICCACFLLACAARISPAVRPISSPPEAVRFLHDRLHETTPYRALLTIRPLTRVGGGVSLDAVLRVDAVDRLRLQGISPLGGVLFALESERGVFELRIPDRGLVSGPVGMLDALYGHLLPLKVSQLMAVLTPYGDSDAVIEGVFSPAVSECPDGAAGWAYPIKTWFIEKTTGNLVRMEIHDEDPDGLGRKALVVEYLDFRQPTPGPGDSGELSSGGRVAMPYRILVKGPDGVPWAELIFQEVHLGRGGDADPGT
ncbi:MAG: hypothetical protein HY760_04685 [Nitrospirae bacterium]|nr:hypothetical protein [Nitrospirota bacterium]